MGDSSPRVLLTIILVFALTALSTGTLPHAQAADCGDGVGPCQCGDRVVANTKLGGSDPVLRTPCPCDGLIVAPGITLDIGGTLTGDNVCSAIVLEGDGTVIKNGKIKGFNLGVDGDSLGGVSGSRVLNLDIVAAFAGILLRGAHNVVESNVVRDAFTAGVLVIGGIGNAVRLNRVEGTAALFGLAVIGDANTVSRNVVRANDGDGIAVAGENVTVELNRVERNQGNGFVVEGASIVVRRNVARSNGINGFDVGASASTLDRNASDDNGRFGIEDRGTANSHLGNRCTRNADGPSSPPGLCR